MGRTDRAETFVHAAPAAVWAAMTDPSRVAVWLPPPGMTCRVEAWEPRAGGRLHVVLTYRDASGAPGKSTEGSDVAVGRFVDAEPPERLVWATRFEGAGDGHAGEMTMVWTLTAIDGGTRVGVEARDVPPGISAEDHAAGLGATLRQLAEHVGAAG
jgi:uncharacterized protein YndB with AHSA1/START domain